MELEEEFRLTVLDLAMKLSEEECRRIAYIASINFDTVPPEHRNDFRLYLISKLESHGKINPLNLKFLKGILMRMGRKDLVDLISRYKKKPVYKEAKRKKSKQKRQGQDQAVNCTGTTPSSIMQYKETYAILLTQFAQITLSTRSALETHDIPKIKEAFSTGGDAICHTLRKLSLDGTNSDSICTSTSSSSGDSSSGMPSIGLNTINRIEYDNIWLSWVGLG